MAGPLGGPANLIMFLMLVLSTMLHVDALMRSAKAGIIPLAKVRTHAPAITLRKADEVVWQVPLYATLPKHKTQGQPSDAEGGTAAVFFHLMVPAVLAICGPIPRLLASRRRATSPAHWRLAALNAGPDPYAPPAPVPLDDPKTEGGRPTEGWTRNRHQSSWHAKAARPWTPEEGRDYLYELGQSDTGNTNVNGGQNSRFVDSLFVQDVVADIADGSLRHYEVRTLSNIVGDYYIPPRFMRAVSTHVVKNLVANDIPNYRPPLILGIWGGKGEGKSFQLELCFREMGLEPIMMSAGELEDEWAGTPARLIRERYKKAAEVVRLGRLSALVINDMDAGLGRFRDTQCTVNQQVAIGQLMNLCDNPHKVPLGASYSSSRRSMRIPIFITANDLSKVYAPLLRDGRMEKFYWKPHRDDLVSMLGHMFRGDGFGPTDLEALHDVFPGQSLDFFGALRAATYDAQVAAWIAERCGGDVRRLHGLLLRSEAPAEVPAPRLSLGDLLAEGRRLCAEQQLVNDLQLSKEYLKEKTVDAKVLKLRQHAEARRARRAVEAQAAAFAQRVSRTTDRVRELTDLVGGAEQLMPIVTYTPDPPPAAPQWASPWEEIGVLEAHRRLTEATAPGSRVVLLDVRPAKDFGREAFRGAVSVPAVVATGDVVRPTYLPNPDFLAAARAKVPDPATAVLVLGSADGDHAHRAAEHLWDAGYRRIAEVRGGYKAWCWHFLPNGRRRPPQGSYHVDLNSAGTVCVGAELDLVHREAGTMVA